MRPLARAWLLLLSTTFFTPHVHAQRVLREGDYIVSSWTTNDRFARRVLDYAREAEFPGLPPGAPAFGQPVRIVLARDDQQFHAETGGRAPDWGAGVAIPEAGVIVLRAYGGTSGAYGELRSLLHHELAHIALHRYLADTRIPRWFDEGYAVWSSGELDTEAAWLLRMAFATNRAPPLDSLELAWPAHATDARVAYLLAASAVQYLVEQSGTRALELFLQRWRTSHDFDAALGATYGLSLDQLEAHWRRDVRHRYGWFAVLVQSAVFATFAAVGVIALYAIRRRRDRARLAELKATEPPDEPAYWIEEDTPDEDAGIDREGESRDI